MPVETLFRCGGCSATAPGTAPLRLEFRSFSGRYHGFGQAVRSNTVEDVTPDGWVAYDPYTYRTYCPRCAEEIGLVRTATEAGDGEEASDGE